MRREWEAKKDDNAGSGGTSAGVVWLTEGSGRDPERLPLYRDCHAEHSEESLLPVAHFG